MSVASNESLAQRIARASLDWIVPAWDVPSRVQALMTTRRGGVSAGAFATLNLGRNGGDAPANVAQNRRRVEAFLPAAPLWLSQVHGTDVVDVRASDLDRYATAPPRADAAVTRDRGVVLAVSVADCMPVLFADRDASVIGIAHAGWRGLAAGVLERTIATMRVDPASVHAWLGAAIGATAFEVGVDVHDAFCAGDPGASAHFAPNRPGKWLADLRGLVHRRLASAGIDHIDDESACTFQDVDRFYSYRRDRATGRMAAFLWLE
jgi:YfiH family protein